MTEQSIETKYAELIDIVNRRRTGFTTIMQSVVRENRCKIVMHNVPFACQLNKDTPDMKGEFIGFSQRTLGDRGPFIIDNHLIAFMINDFRDVIISQKEEIQKTQTALVNSKNATTFLKNKVALYNSKSWWHRLTHKIQS